MFCVCDPNTSVSSAYSSSAKVIPFIGSCCFGVLVLSFISAMITDISSMKRYGLSGHPCLIPDFRCLYSDSDSFVFTLNFGAS